MPPRSPDEGVVREFGVFWGATVDHLTWTGGTIDAFDPFEELPEDWRCGYAKGPFARHALPRVAGQCFAGLVC